VARAAIVTASDSGIGKPLCSDDAAFMTGASLPIDGGLLLVSALRNQEQS
jgi:hypothetical protein